jgi:glycosyltransferase involved in cell wall biosynthesis
MIMNVVHLTDSPFFGGPERQMLGLAVGLPASIRTSILCFRDHASAAPFLERLAAAGVPARMLAHANPHFAGMVGDVVGELRRLRADVLVCHGYKADVIGWIAARIARVPVMSVSRGWTGHTRKVRLNEAIDRRMLRRMARVVCVSEGQAAKVRRAGVRGDRVRVIHNAIDTTRFTMADAGGRALLEAMFPAPPELIVVGIGRLSPEKGFDRLVEAARLVVAGSPRAGFVLIGDGPDRAALAEQVRAAGLDAHVVLAGFRSDVDRLLQGADVLAQSSYTEGLPNVVLEACAAGIPVVATVVGGTGEVVQDGVTGYLVPAGDAGALADRLLALLRSPAQRREMGDRGRDVVVTHFSFASQCAEYENLFATLTSRRAQDLAAPGRQARSAVTEVAG